MDYSSDSEDGQPIRLHDLNVEKKKMASSLREDTLNWPKSSRMSSLPTKSSLYDDEELIPKAGVGGKSQIAESRLRLSRLIDREKLMRSRQVSASSSNTTALSSSMLNMSRTKTHSPAKTRQNISEAKQLITRSLSPSPRKQSTFRNQPEVEDLAPRALRNADTPAIKEISEFMHEQTQRIVESSSLAAIRDHFSSARSDLSGLSVSQVQLWMNRGGALESVHEDSGVTITISPQTMIQLVGEHHYFNRAQGGHDDNTAANIVYVPHCRTIHNDDTSWDEVQRAMQLVSSDSRVWHSIHVVSIPCCDQMLAGPLSLNGVILVSEAYPASVPVIAMTNRIYRNSTAQLKTNYLIECTEKLAMACCLRFHQLQAAIEREQLSQSLACQTAFNTRQSFLQTQEQQAADATDFDKLAAIIANYSCGIVSTLASSAHSWVGLPGRPQVGSGPILTFSCHSNDEQETALGRLVFPSGIVANLIRNASSSTAVIVGSVRELEAGGIGVVRTESLHSSHEEMMIIYFSVPCNSNNSSRSQRIVVMIGVPLEGPEGDSDSNDTAAMLREQAALVATFAIKSLSSLNDKYLAALSKSLLSIPSVVWGSLGAHSSSGRGEVHKLARTLESETIVKCFHATKVSLILSDEFGASLNICPAAIPRTMKFLVSSDSCSGWTKLLEAPLALSVLPWLQDLQAGKVVTYAAVSPDEYVPDSFVALKAYVEAVDRNAASAVLLPIKTAYGLCVACIIHKRLSDLPHEHGRSVIAASHNDRVASHGSFETLDLAEAIEHARLGADLASAISTAHRLNSAELLSAICNKRDEQIESMSKLLHTAKQKSLTALHFSKWRQALERDNSRAANSILTATMEMLSPPQSQLSSSEKRSSLKVFLALLKSQVSSAFPTDSASVSEGMIDGVSPPGEEHASLMAAAMDGSSILYTPINPTISSRLSGEKVVLVGFVKETVIAHDPSHEPGHRVVGTVRIVRSAGRGNITPHDVQILSQLCQMASMVFSASQRDSYVTQAEGDVRGLLLPFLRRIVPLLVDGPRRDSETMRAMLPSLAQILKLICGAEVAILRLHSTQSTSSSSAPGLFQPVELLVSSEDSEHYSVTSFIGTHSDALVDQGYLVDSSAQYSTEDSSDGGSRGYAQLVVKLRDPVEGSMVGEIKVLGPSNPEGFEVDHHAAVELVAFILSHSMATARRFARSDESIVNARTLMSKLESALDGRGQDIAIEKGANLVMRKRLSAALAMILCMNQMSESRSAAQLAHVVSESLPLVLGSRNAVLLLREDLMISSTDQSSSEIVQGLRVVAAAAAANMGSAALPAELQEFVPLTDLAAVPSYFDTPTANQAKIIFAKGNGEAPYGAVLLFGRRAGSDNEASAEAWEGLEDVLLTGLVGAIEACLRNISSVQTQELFEQCLAESSLLRNEVAGIPALELQRAAQTERITAMERQLEEKIHELELAEVAQQQLLASHQGQIEVMRVGMRELGGDMAALEESRDSCSATRDALVSLVQEFSFDHAGHNETVPAWLHKYAGARDCVMVMITQAEDGTLFCGGVIEEIRGVTGAAGEALRTGSSVVIHSSVVANSSLLRRWPSVWREAEGPISAAGRLVPCSILCVPNKCINLDTKCDHACYVFIRPAATRADSFTSHDTTLLEGASSLASRIMMRATSRYTVHELRSMELEIQRERALVYKVRHAILSSETLFRRNCRSFVEAGREIEATVVDLLSRGEVDTCMTTCQCYLLPEGTTAGTISTFGKPAQVYFASKGLSPQEIDMVQRACTSPRGLRVASTLWTPIKGTDGRIIAAVRTERRLSTVITTHDSSVSSQESKRDFGTFPAAPSTHSDALQAHNALIVSSAPTLSDLLISEEEEEAVSILCRQASWLMARIKLSIDTLESMEQAGAAMVLLQSTVTELDQKVGSESEQRKGLEQTLRAGVDMLSAGCVKRFSVEQVLETARKAIMSITLSDESYIVLPKIADVFPVPQSLQETIPDGFYTLENDRANPLRVRFEGTDMEFISMQSSRISTAPSEGSPDQGHNQLSNNWAVRRFLGQMSFASDLAMSPSNMHAITVPFLLQNGSLAVVSALRRNGTSFTTADKECISWVARVLAYCLEMWAGKGSIKEGEAKVALLEQEISRLRLSEERLRCLEVDNSVLQSDLLRFADPTASSLVDISTAMSTQDLEAEARVSVLATVRMVFIGLDASCQSAAEAGQSVGELLPWGLPSEAGVTAVDASDSRGVFESSAGRATYWVGTRGNRPMLVVLVNHRSYPTTWINVFFSKEITGDNNSFARGQARFGLVGLRVALVMRLLDAQEGWMGQTRIARNEVIKLIGHVDTANAQVSNAAASLNSMKLQSTDASVAAVQLLTAAMTACTDFQRSASEFARGKAISQDIWLKSAVQTLGRDFSAVGYEVSLGLVESQTDVSSSFTATTPPTNTSDVKRIAWYLAQETSPWTLAGADLVPVQSAVQGGQTVITASTDGPGLERSTATLESGMELAARMMGNDVAVSFSIMPLQSAFYTMGSMVVPLRLPAQRGLGSEASAPLTLILLLRALPGMNNINEKAMIGSDSDHAGWAAMFVAGVELGMSIRESLHEALSYQRTLTSCRKMAISRSISARSTIQRAQSFAVLRENVYRTRLGLALGECQDIAATKSKLRVVEQSLADWAEMARGLNGAASGINGGTNGIWTKACGVLMSMTTSYITLRGCGLCLESTSGDVVELSVRGLSTPVSRVFNRSTGEFEEPNYDGGGHRGSLVIRPVSELGGDVAGLATELLRSGPYRDAPGGSGYRQPARLHKLGRGGSESEFGDELTETWMVPVRTAHQVLAVLRLTVVNPIDRAQLLGGPGSHGGSYNTPAPKRDTSPTRIRFTDPPTTPMTRSGDVSAGRSSMTVRSAISIGSAVSAATHVTATTNSPYDDSQGMEGVSRVDAAQLIVMNFAEMLAPLISAAVAQDYSKIATSQHEDELRAGQGRITGLKNDLSVASNGSALMAVALGVVGDYSLRSIDYTSKEFNAQIFIQQVCESLARVLQASISVTLNEHSVFGAVDYSSSRENATHSSTMSEILMDEKDNVVGRLLVSVQNPAAAMKVSDLRLLAGDEESGTLESNGHNSAARSISMILKPLSKALVALFSNAKRASTLAGEKQVAMLYAAETEKRISDSEQHAADLTRELQRNAAIISVTKQCLACLDTPPLTGVETLVASRSPVHKLCFTLQPTILNVAGLIAPSACSIALLAGLFNPANLGEPLHQSTWSSTLDVMLPDLWPTNIDPAGEGMSAIATGNIPYSLNESSREIIDNLAKACVMRRFKSSVDICDNSDVACRKHENSSIRVLSYPLLSALGGTMVAVGVLQVITSENVVPGDFTDAFFDTIAGILGTTAACEHYRRVSVHTQHLTETQRQTASDLAEQTAHSLRAAQRRELAWQDVASLSAGLVTGVSAGAGKPLAEIVSNGLVGRRESGLTVSIILQSGLGAGALNADGCRSSALVPITESSSDSTELVARINLPTQADGESDEAILALVPIEQSLVETLGGVLRAVYSITSKNAVTTTGLKKQLEDSSRMLRDVQSSLDVRASEVIQIEKLRQFSLNSMSSFCGPTIREIAVMLEEIGSGRRLMEADDSPQENSAQNNSGKPAVDSDAAIDRSMDWAWDGLARIADRALARISEKAFEYHASILVRESKQPKTILSTNARPADEGIDLRVRIFDSSRRQEVLTIANNRGIKSARMGVLSDPNVCTLEKALLTGGIHEVTNSISQVDLIGIDKQILAAMFDNTSLQSRVHVLCVALPDAPPGILAVLRLVFPSDPVGSEGLMEVSRSTRHLVRPVMEMVMSLGCAVVHISRHLAKNRAEVKGAVQTANRASKEKEIAQEQLSRARRMHRTVCREACTLLDPPLVGPGGHAPRAVHPASLTPIAASQDSCTKLLNISRSLLRGEGQALLLRDPTTDPITFQVIFSGNVLGWAGIEQGSFGLASRASQSSLAEACMHSHQTISVDDGPCDPRYSAVTDGGCPPGSPMLFVPLRGRGSAVIGCLIVARAKGASAFSSEDIAAAEIVGSHGALTLYWCQGLGSLHHVLSKNVTKMEELEKAVASLSKLDRGTSKVR